MVASYREIAIASFLKVRSKYTAAHMHMRYADTGCLLQLIAIALLLLLLLFSDRDTICGRG